MTALAMLEHEAPRSAAEISRDHTPEFLLEYLEATSALRAYLAREGDLDFTEAVDVCWSRAERWRLVEHFGVDIVQATIAAGFKRWRRDPD